MEFDSCEGIGGASPGDSNPFFVVVDLAPIANRPFALGADATRRMKRVAVAPTDLGDIGAAEREMPIVCGAAESGASFGVLPKARCFSCFCLSLLREALLFNGGGGWVSGDQSCCVEYAGVMVAPDGPALEEVEFGLELESLDCVFEESELDEKRALVEVIEFGVRAGV